KSFVKNSILQLLWLIMKHYLQMKSWFRISYLYCMCLAVDYMVCVSIKNRSRRMRKLLKSYKTEIDPTPEQIQIFHRTIGTCRFVYNFYLAHKQEIYQKEKRFISGMDFSKWLNNEYIPNNPEYQWIKEVSSKSVKK